jgi:DUF1365 family protein
MSDAALYDGVVVHRRFAPKAHALRYRMFMALLDIDRLDALDAELRLFSRNRFNLFAFFDRDHLPKEAPPATRLRDLVEGHLATAGVRLDGGAIRLLTLPRILGYAFNPLSIYFCHQPDGSLAAILYEVTNTFKQRHTYVIPVESGADASAAIHQRCGKAFYVSPFLDMDMTYDFRVVAPSERVAVAVDGSKGPARIIATSFAGTRRPFTDAALLRAFLRHPLVAVMVVAGIHWEALKLWGKGIGLRSRPAPPAQTATFVPRREV